MRMEDDAIIGDTEAAALVGRDGSIDWLCRPRFDSRAWFASLLGGRTHGRWKLAPAWEGHRVERSYLTGTLVLTTTFRTSSGTARVLDCMRLRGDAPDLVRIVEGVTGAATMEMDLVVRFDYGSTIPWTRRVDGALSLVAGPDAIELVIGAPMHGEDLVTRSTFVVRPGDRVPFVLTWHSSWEAPPGRIDPFRAIDATAAWWCTWSERCAQETAHPELVQRSLIPLKALTFAPTGGIVAAPTTSLPEVLGGERNWDYRFCWLRDATLTLQAMLAGYEEEAVSWRDWLLRAIAGDPSHMQIMYGVGGQRRLPEQTLPWLPGYEASGHVRIGNAAASQRQLDVYGEVMDGCTKRAQGVSRRNKSPGLCSDASLTGSRGAGATPTPGRGRCAANPGTSSTRRSRAGSGSIAPLWRWNGIGWTPACS